jgi:hypothetical protein
VHTIILNGSGSGSALPLKIFDEMQNGAIWGHFRVSYNIKSSTIMPVAGATAERSSSVVRYMKTYVRSTMKNDGLSSLGLMHLHRDFEHVGQILNNFKKFMLRVLRVFTKFCLVLVRSSVIKILVSLVLRCTRFLSFQFLNRHIICAFPSFI